MRGLFCWVFAIEDTTEPSFEAGSFPWTSAVSRRRKLHRCIPAGASCQQETTASNSATTAGGRFDGPREARPRSAIDRAREPAREGSPPLVDGLRRPGPAGLRDAGAGHADHEPLPARAGHPASDSSRSNAKQRPRTTPADGCPRSDVGVPADRSCETSATPHPRTEVLLTTATPLCSRKSEEPYPIVDGLLAVRGVGAMGTRTGRSAERIFPPLYL